MSSQHLYVKRVAHNFKADLPHPPTNLDLAPRTLITGRNGQGHKSAPLHAIHAALTAEVDGVNGKNGVRDPETLIKFAPDKDKPSTEVSARVVVGFMPDALDRADGREFTAAWSLQQSEGKVHQPIHSLGVRALLPRRLVDKLMYGDVKQARANMLSICALVGVGGTLTMDALAGEIPLHLQSKFLDIATRMEKKHGIAEVLAETAAYADERMRELNREAKAARQSATNIETRAAEQQKAQGARRPEEPARRKHRDPDQVRAEIEEAQTSLAQWKEAEQALLDQLAQASIQATSGRNMPSRVRDVLALHLSKDAQGDLDDCPICTSRVGRQFLADTLAWAEESTVSSENQARAETGLRGRIEADLREATDAIGEWNDVLSARKAELAAAEVDARAAVLAAASMRDQPGPAELAKAARQDAAAAEAEAEVYRSLKGACNEAAVRLLKSRADAFAELASLYVPPAMGRVGVALEDQGRQALDVGLLRTVKDGEGNEREVLHVLLSDIERVVVECAIARMLAEAQIRQSKEQGEPLLVLLDPEDRNWDGQTLIEAMRCWSDFPGQVILTVPQAPWQMAPLSDHDDSMVPLGWRWVDQDRGVSLDGEAAWADVSRHVARGAPSFDTAKDDLQRKAEEMRKTEAPSLSGPVAEDAGILTRYAPACLALALEVFDAGDRQTARRKGKALAEQHPQSGPPALYAVASAYKGEAAIGAVDTAMLDAAGIIESVVDALFPPLRRGRKPRANAESAVEPAGTGAEKVREVEPDEVPGPVRLDGSDGLDQSGNGPTGSDGNDSPAPAPERKGPSKSAREVLLGLGYKAEAVDAMSDDTAADAIRRSVHG